jgi:hypothetical protein
MATNYVGANHHVIHIILHDLAPGGVDQDPRNPLSPTYKPSVGDTSGAYQVPKPRRPKPYDPRKDPPGNRANNPYGSAHAIPRVKYKPKAKPLPNDKSVNGENPGFQTKS